MTTEVLRATSLKWAPDGLLMTLWFHTQLDMDDIRARIESFASGPRTPLAGSWIATHICTHSDPLQLPCAPVRAREW